MTKLVRSFAALGDATRMAIVERLLDKGALSAGELLDVAQVSPPAISRHLKVLREAGVITQKIDQQRRIYAVRQGAVEEINAWTMSRKEFWGKSLDRLMVALLSTIWPSRPSAVDVGGGRYKVSGHVTHVDPPKSVGFTWAWHDEKDKRGVESHVTIKLVPAQGGGTEFELSHVDLPDDESASSHKQGWESTLRKLDTLIKQ